MARKLWIKFLNRLASLSSNGSPIVPFNLGEELLIGSRLLFIPVTFLWGVMYILLGEIQSGLIPFIYSFILGLLFIVFLKKRNPIFLETSHRLLTLLLPLFLQLSLGGFINSSAVVLWSFTSPLSTLLGNNPKIAIRSFIGFFLVVIIGGILDPYIVRDNIIPQNIKLMLFVMNIAVLLGTSFMLLLYMVNKKNQVYRLLTLEQEKSEALLLNIFPKEIAEILKNENRLVADAFPNASILFADLVGFTALSDQLTPIEMVQLLNEIYSHLDTMVEKYDLEKIKTIGDNYMVAAGVPVSRPDHAQALAQMALDISGFMVSFTPVKGNKLQFRMGINSGPVIAGVVGKKKFHYDVWGDVVNFASRMESHGVPGKIQVSDATYNLIQNDFEFESRGVIKVKGKGDVETWFLVSKNGI